MLGGWVLILVWFGLVLLFKSEGERRGERKRGRKREGGRDLVTGYERVLDSNSSK